MCIRDSYNYVFDPHVYLKRFFGEGGTAGPYIFLIDEAHNLVERGREMYSASLVKEDFLALTKVVHDYDARMERLLEKCNRHMLQLKRECEGCRIVQMEEIDALIVEIGRLAERMETYLEDHDDSPWLLYTSRCV